MTDRLQQTEVRDGTSRTSVAEDDALKQEIRGTRHRDNVKGKTYSSRIRRAEDQR